MLNRSDDARNSIIAATTSEKARRGAAAGRMSGKSSPRIIQAVRINELVGHPDISGID